MARHLEQWRAIVAAMKAVIAQAEHALVDKEEPPTARFHPVTPARPREVRWVMRANGSLTIVDQDGREVDADILPGHIDWREIGSLDWLRH
jgi:hypothetical protein